MSWGYVVVIVITYTCLFYLVYKRGKRKQETIEKNDHSKEDDIS